MEEDQIKYAFSKVKEDMYNLREELSEIKDLVVSLQDELNTQELHNIAENNPFLPQNPLNIKNQSDIPNYSNQTHNATVRHSNTTDTATSTHNTTVPQEIGGLRSPNLGISTGNEGVSTDRQTVRQTDNYTQNIPQNAQNNRSLPQNSIESNISEAREILDSLDQIKRQIRLQFKRVTTQEMAVFSTIYQLEEQNPEQVTYNNIALKLGLSQSSIRDYVQRMMTKGIPIKKQKVNNRQIILSISDDLRRIASLNTIVKLREL